MRWHLSPDQIDAAGKIAGGATVVCTTVLGLWKPVGTRIRAAQDKRQRAEVERLTAIVEIVVNKALTLREEQWRDAFRAGAKHEQEQFLALASEVSSMGLTVKSVSDWTGTHEESDQGQFLELGRDMAGLKVGQKHTHALVTEMKGDVKLMGRAMAATNENLAEIRGMLRGIMRKDL
jgi:hypothetical protein